MKETGVSLFTKVGSYSNDVFPSSAATMLTNLKALITHLKHTTALQFQQKGTQLFSTCVTSGDLTDVLLISRKEIIDRQSVLKQYLLQLSSRQRIWCSYSQVQIQILT